MKIKTNKIFLTSLAFSIFFGTAGSVYGTFAWYSYSSRASVIYKGTAVSESGALEVGIISEKRLNFSSDFNVTEDIISVGGKYIYWANNSLNSDIISYYCLVNGYSSSTLGATSSGSYSQGKDFVLKRSPVYRSSFESFAAKKTDYSFVPLVFRIPSEGGNSYLSNASISLTNLEVESEKELNKAVRLFVDNKIDSYILNPSESISGYDEVAGILDLDQDGYYDYSSDSSMKELVYGEYISLTYGDKYIDDTELEGESNTFNAKHMKNSTSVNYDAKHAEYLGRSDVMGSGKTITKTNSKGIAYLDLTIYLEGWDKSCVDAELTNSFNLNMEFTYN